MGAGDFGRDAELVGVRGVEEVEGVPLAEPVVRAMPDAAAGRVASRDAVSSGADEAMTAVMAPHATMLPTPTATRDFAAGLRRLRTGDVVMAHLCGWDVLIVSHKGKHLPCAR